MTIFPFLGGGEEGGTLFDSESWSSERFRDFAESNKFRRTRHERNPRSFDTLC